MNKHYFLFYLIYAFCNTSIASTINLQLSSLNEIKLAVPATLNNKNLGTALAVSGLTAAVAALPGNNSSTGSVYIYDALENWRLSQELGSQHLADNFASSIVLVNDRLIISADHDDSNGVDSGAVYIFEKNHPSSGWQQIAKLTAPDALTNDQFGKAVSLIDNNLYIGAPMHHQGKVYIFTRHSTSGQWQMSDSIEPSDPQALQFGAAIAQDQQTLIIGAPYTDAENTPTETPRNRQSRFAISKEDTEDPGIESGAIFIYESIDNKWQQRARLGSENRESGDHLGEQISIQDDTIIASIKSKDVFDDLRAGAVYIYKKINHTWQEDTALYADIRNIGANFGNSFSLFNDNLLVGANKAHSNGFNSGQTYLYTKNTNSEWFVNHLQTNSELQAHDQFGLSVALEADYLLIASKKAVYAFQNTPIQQNPASFYPRSNILQLDEIAVHGLGVFSATLQLSQQAEVLILTLSSAHLRNDIAASNINFSTETGLLTIPHLAVQIDNKSSVFYSLTLQQIHNTKPLQFQVKSIASANP